LYRRATFILGAYCLANFSDVERLCSGVGVRWELEELTVSSSKAETIHRRQNWTALANGGATLKVSGNALPFTVDYVAFEVKAYGQFSNLY